MTRPAGTSFGPYSMLPATAAAVRAIALDDTLAEAHVSLGTIKLPHLARLMKFRP